MNFAASNETLIRHPFATVSWACARAIKLLRWCMNKKLNTPRCACAAHATRNTWDGVISPILRAAACERTSAVGFRNVLEDLRNKNVQGLLSTEEIARWINAATSKVDAPSTTSCLTNETSSKLKEETDYDKKAHHILYNHRRDLTGRYRVCHAPGRQKNYNVEEVKLRGEDGQQFGSE